MGEKTKIHQEFEDIDTKNLWVAVYMQIRSLTSAYDYTLDEAKKLKNRTLNRYRDVIPYDHSRIVLKRTESDYINANEVEIEKANRKYILTQGPLPDTISHFWVMIWEQNCKAIVMLNKLIEKNQLKCSQYWPSSSDADLNFPDLNLNVHLESELNHIYYITRNIRLKDTSTSEEKDILLFHYTTWPDFGVPQCPTSLLRLIRAVRKSGALDNNFGPPVVHCSAGIGRSGTFILVDGILKLISDKGAESVNIQEILMEMRHYRMGLIQTPDQLKFSYQAIIEGIDTNWEDDDENALPPCNEEEVQKPNGFLPEEDLSSSGSDEPPPLPPPRTQPTLDWSNKPLPALPPTPAADDDSDDEEEISSRSSSPENDSTTNPITSENNPRKRKLEELREKVEKISNKQKETEEKKKKNIERWEFVMNLLTNPYSMLGGLLVLGGGLYFMFSNSSSSPSGRASSIAY